MKNKNLFKEKVLRTIYTKICRYCGLHIKGTSESQVKYNLKYHVDRKHKKEVLKNDSN